MLLFYIIGIACFLGMAALQGGIVYATARGGFDALHWESNAAKLLAMAVAYFLWAVLPIYAYSEMGGEGGLMDGFGLVLVIALAGLVGTLGWTARWLINPSEAGDLSAQ